MPRSSSRPRIWLITDVLRATQRIAYTVLLIALDGNEPHVRSPHRFGNSLVRFAGVLDAVLLSHSCCPRAKPRSNAASRTTQDRRAGHRTQVVVAIIALLLAVCGYRMARRPVARSFNRLRALSGEYRQTGHFGLPGPVHGRFPPKRKYGRPSAPLMWHRIRYLSAILGIDTHHGGQVLI